MRAPVEPKRSYRLINHGPTTLITSAHAGRVNVMAAAWVMALDFDPPKIAACIDGSTFTRELVDASGEFTVSLPTVEMADATWAVGKTSGRDVADKFTRFGLRTHPASKVAAPLVEGCAAWLECRVIPYADTQKNHDLFVAEVVAAWADDSLFVNGEWRFDADPKRRTIHHLHRGIFFATGERVDAKDLTSS